MQITHTEAKQAPVVVEHKAPVVEKHVEQKVHHEAPSHTQPAQQVPATP
jgi:hypothetical protein